MTLNVSSHSNCNNNIYHIPRIRPTKETVEICRHLMLELPDTRDFDEFKRLIVNACDSAGMFRFPSSRSHKPGLTKTVTLLLKPLG